ncbi:MAG: bacteriophage abortive infection AbiH family protein [Oscillospiraceae bacterium]|nr:bacteriophage abortive infection AbiH family protein [Oscillospiraceae bacterium]
MSKTVLILGNGFDLAHGLPTKYSDFLNFCDTISCIPYVSKNDISEEEFKIKFLDEINLNEKARMQIIDACKESFSIFSTNIESIKHLKPQFLKIREVYDITQKNVWYIYLFNIYHTNSMRGDKWIDFEREIRFIVKIIDMYTNNLSNSFSETILYIKRKYKKGIEKFDIFCSILFEEFTETGSVRDLRKLLYSDLEDFIYMLEIYFCHFANNEIIGKSRDIENLKFDYILNFNYTFTYENHYLKQDTSVCHVHGICYTNRDKEDNNMVLGIDEYWSEQERDDHTNFTIFKKFAQRIQKRTYAEHCKWIKEIKDNYKNLFEISNVYVFGHSLDITDKDILYDYLNDEATAVTIFCRDKETEGEYIANVIKLIGEKRLLEKINQYPPKLKFVIQSPMQIDITDNEQEEEPEKYPVAAK